MQNNENNKLVDVHGDEIEVVSEVENAPDMSVANLEHLEKVAEGIERFVNAQQKITNTLLRLAKPGDWVQFGNYGCLGGAGAERIASAVGISFSNWQEWKEEGEDKNGKFYWWWHKCNAKLGLRTLEVQGRAGSRDKFFGKSKGAIVPMADINEGNIRMASRRNTMKEGVKVLLGIRNMPIDELTKAGIKMVAGGGVEFKKEEKVITPEDTKMQDRLKEVLLKLCEGDVSKAENQLELLTTWTKTEKDPAGKVIKSEIVKGKRSTKEVSGKQLVITIAKAEALLKSKENIDNV